MTDVHLTSVPAARVDQVAKIGDPYPFNPFRKRYNRKASRIDPPHERTRGDAKLACSLAVGEEVSRGG
jgi:hypothetical protein